MSGDDDLVRADYEAGLAYAAVGSDKEWSDRADRRPLGLFDQRGEPIRGDDLDVILDKKDIPRIGFGNQRVSNARGVDRDVALG